MPPQYEALKKKFLAEGKSEDAAQESAARIFNAQRKPGEAPVGPKHHGQRRRARKLRKGQRPMSG